jgi:hypothetical protein
LISLTSNPRHDTKLVGSILQNKGAAKVLAGRGCDNTSAAKDNLARKNIAANTGMAGSKEYHLE